MKNLKQILTLLTGGLVALNSFAADAPDRPIHVLYLGAVSLGGGARGPGGGGFGGGGGSRTNYVYLPGQNLATEAIYFDYRADVTNLTDAYLKHFDAVVQVMPDAEVGPAQQKMLDAFKSAGHGLIKYADGQRPADGVLREAVLGAVSKKAKADWEASTASRPQLQRLPGEVPNYERRAEPVKYQAPLSPKDSMRYTQVPADFDLQLFAAEPDIVKPIYMAWDERGRAWVVEARDYPHGLLPAGEPGHDSIKICEDTDGDGKADKFTIFADKLNLATALVFVNGGIMVSEARHMLFLKDTNGDDKADVREAILPGWGTGDTHAMQSNLGRGFDNWLYGAVGYSNFRGNVGGKELQFGQGVFRFKADGSALEFLHQYNNNTWGFGLNTYGDVFGSTANGHPTFYGYLPAHILNPTQPGFGRRGGGGGGGFRPGYRLGPDNAPETPAATVRRLPSAKSLAPGMRMHPNTPNVRMVDNFGGYTAAAGHAFMVSDALPPRLQGKALVTEPTAKLIGIMDIQPDGGGYKASDGGNQFWCLTAQGLIVDNKMTDAAPALKKRVRSGSGGKGAIHALWSLEGIGALDKDTHQAALLSKDPAVRRNAVRALPANEAGRQLFFSSAVIQDPDLITRQVALVKLAEFPTIPAIQTVVAQLPRIAANMNDPFLNDTLTLLGRIHKVSGVGENEVKVAAGDVKRGEDLFHNSPVAACVSCHQVGGKGGDVGPIIDGIAVRADKAYITESLMDPNAKLAKGFETLGISPMPPLGVLLKEQETADILAYLDTLKTPPKDGVTVPVKKANPFE